MKLYLDEDYSNELRTPRGYDNIFEYADQKVEIVDISINIQTDIKDGYIEVLCGILQNGVTSEDIYATFTYDEIEHVMYKQKIHKKLSRFYYLFDSDVNASNIDVIVAYK